MTQTGVARRSVTAPGGPPAVGPTPTPSGTASCCSARALPLHPDTQELVADSLAAETAQCLRNLVAVCEAAGTRLGQTLRVTISTADLASFAEINEADAAFFAEDPPARAAVGVAALPKGARVEIDAIVAMT